MSPPEQSRSVDDTGRFLDRIRALLVERFRRGDLARFELYGRRTIATRVSRGDPSDAPWRSGVDEGLAVRLQLRDENSLRFSASSGSGRRALDRAVFTACRSGRIASVDERSWPCGEGLVEDLDPLPQDPEPAAVERWLEAAWSASVGTGVAPRSAWVERAVTIEAWVSNRGLRAVRRRVRGWALLQPARSAPTGGTARPTIVAARRFDRLDSGAWGLGSKVDGRALPPWRRPPTGSPVDLELAAEPAARLAHALVRSLSVGSPTSASPVAVGPGWRIEDSPRDPDALFGGLFDDAAFPTRPRRLADGRELVDRLDGPGHFRRASFRDLPEPLPSHLTVRPPRVSTLGDGVRVNGLRVHPIGQGRWLLELTGFRIEGGDPVARCPILFVRTSPQELVARCIGGHGPSAMSYLGVSTPALVFRDLPVA